MHIFHKWTKWEEYDQQMIVIPGIFYPVEQRGKQFRIIEKFQKRTCEKCGFTERREVK